MSSKGEEKTAWGTAPLTDEHRPVRSAFVAIVWTRTAERPRVVPGIVRAWAGASLRFHLADAGRAVIHLPPRVCAQNPLVIDGPGEADFVTGAGATSAPGEMYTYTIEVTREVDGKAQTATAWGASPPGMVLDDPPRRD